MLNHRDFVPTAVKGKWYKGKTYETFDAALEAANAWLKKESPKLVNVETVVLPNIHAREESGSTDSSIMTMSGWAEWNQFLRVWYTT